MPNSSFQPTPTQAVHLHSVFGSLADLSSRNLQGFTCQMAEVLDCVSAHRPGLTGDTAFLFGQIQSLFLTVSNRYDLFLEMTEIYQTELEKEASDHA